MLSWTDAVTFQSVEKTFKHTKSFDGANKTKDGKVKLINPLLCRLDLCKGAQRRQDGGF